MLGFGLNTTCLSTPMWAPDLIIGDSLALMFDLSRLDTLSQDAAGTIPANAPGQPVGLVRDLSRGGRHASQATSAARPTLGRHPRSGRRNLLTWTEDFANAAWFKGGGVTFSADGTLGGVPAFKLVDGSTTDWALLMESITGQGIGPFTMQVRVKKRTDATTLLSARFGINDGTIIRHCGAHVNPNTGDINSVYGGWTYRRTSFGVSDGGDHWLLWVSADLQAGDTLQFFEIFPAHFNFASSGAASNVGENTVAAPQVARGFGPTEYQRVTTAFDVTEALPQEPRRNLLEKTDALNSAPWVAFNSSTVSPAGALGGAAAFSVADVVSNNYGGADQVVSLSTPGAYTAQVRVGKTSSAAHLASFRVAILDAGSVTRFCGMSVNPNTGAPNTGAGGWTYGRTAATVTDGGDHWLMSVTFTLSAGEAITAFATFPSHFDLAGAAAAPHVGSQIFAGPQLEAGITPTAYQRVADQYSNPPMVPDLWYLSTDAIDDFLAIAAFEWGSDEVTIVAALRKRSDAAEGQIVHFSPAPSPGGFRLTHGTGGNRLWAGSRGETETFAVATDAVFAAPVSVVMAMRGKIGTDTNTLRVNGVQISSTTSDQGVAATYGNSQFRIGSRGGAFAAMDLYALFAINRLLSPAELAQVERWAASEMGVTL